MELISSSLPEGWIHPVKKEILFDKLGIAA
jgi:hypothetical protein